MSKPKSARFGSSRTRKIFKFYYFLRVSERALGLGGSARVLTVASFGVTKEKRKKDAGEISPQKLSFNLDYEPTC